MKNDELEVAKEILEKIISGATVSRQELIDELKNINKIQAINAGRSDIFGVVVGNSLMEKVVTISDFDGVTPRTALSMCAKAEIGRRYIEITRGG